MASGNALLQWMSERLVESMSESVCVVNNYSSCCSILNPRHPILSEAEINTHVMLRTTWYKQLETVSYNTVHQPQKTTDHIYIQYRRLVLLDPYISNWSLHLCCSFGVPDACYHVLLHLCTAKYSRNTANKSLWYYFKIIFIRHNFGWIMNNLAINI